MKLFSRDQLIDFEKEKTAVKTAPSYKEEALFPDLKWLESEMNGIKIDIVDNLERSKNGRSDERTQKSCCCFVR